MKPIMTDQELFAKVAQMRDWQKSYFQYRTSDALARAKECEREIDKELERRKNPDTQRSLFEVELPKEDTNPPTVTHIVFRGYSSDPKVIDATTYVWIDEDGLLHIKTVRQIQGELKVTGMMNFDKPNTYAFYEYMDGKVGPKPMQEKGGEQ